MKFLFTLLFSVSIFAANIKCESFYQIEQDFGLDVEMSFTLKSFGDGEYHIKDRNISFAVDADEGSPWYEFNGSSEKVITNNKSYKPRKYKGHVQFDYTSGLDEVNGEEGFFGYTSFLLPISSISDLHVGSEFKAILIMSWVSDHWGASRTLGCQVTSL
ncbi:hypothetical protein [Bacteriovorax sp. Seq25_V]|uniref:hypothetical protein n=1 Tax=Bacteriovorax sp. Seq25_V TaxID=1201288 RepID=UPI00038A2235|nr:hypothetical protein [Bacteriovorax sp. Seq25_V]EQC43711.1 hypothetical protein M900_1189 [Bacteriovorax sp. Seq25_V]